MYNCLNNMYNTFKYLINNLIKCVIKNLYVIQNLVFAVGQW